MKRPITRAAAVLLLPTVCGVLALWSLSGRADNLALLPAAVVNLDQIVTSSEGDDEQTIAAGRLLAGALTSPQTPAEETLDWQLTDAGDAEKGLTDGTYQAVLTIPADFSATIAALSKAGRGEGTAEPATIQVRSNDSASVLVGLLTDQVADAAAASVGRQITTGFLVSTFDGFSELSVGLGEAADGGAQLRDGTTALAAGAGTLAAGAGELAVGTGEVAAGAIDLAAGADDLAAGARRVSGGAADLAAGVTTLGTQAATLPQSTQTLATGATQVAGGLGELATGLAALAEQCSLVTPSAEFCGQLGSAASSAGSLVAGADQVAAGTGSLAAAAPALRDGIGTLGAGATALAQGAASVHAGAGALATGVGTLADGAGQAADGAAALSTGATGLATGATDLTVGAQDLAAGLSDAAGGVPDLTGADGAVLADVVVQPVVAQSSRINASPGGATDSAPLVVALVLWLGAFASLLVLEALPARKLAAPSSAAGVALLGWRRSAVWGLVQAAVLGASLPLLGISLVSPVAAVGLTALAAVVFAAINQALVALWGRTGWVVSIALLGAQVAALGGIVPIETAPAVFRALNGVLPVPLVVDGLAHLTLGGQVGSLSTVVASLLGWLVVSLGVSTLVARGRQQTSVARLRRDLVAVPA
ncbi:YhgE/Pip domain-containing protein [Pengzhenrongella frigida]|uniref:YhgE/Pip domain-containing protein n=1 Tax=Pengzhenrongella frigida TaxID=1259133 RepID=UPI0013EBB309|nr:YhgE/Pip family protein [Cellulomonas sp. HLT2-17]